MLGVQPELGRLLVQSDDTFRTQTLSRCSASIIGSGDLGARSRGLLNQAILVNGHPFTVVGVAQRGFHSAVMGDTPDLFTPMMMKAEVMPGEDELEERKASWLNIIGRLKPGGQPRAGRGGRGSTVVRDPREELKQRGHSSEQFVESFLTKSHLLYWMAQRDFLRCARMYAFRC